MNRSKLLMAGIPDVFLSDVAAEIKNHFPDLNLKTAIKHYVDLQIAINHHVPTVQAKERSVVKIRLASILSEAMHPDRRN